MTNLEQVLERVMPTFSELRPKDDKAKVAKDWASWNEQHPYIPHPRESAGPGPHQAQSPKDGSAHIVNQGGVQSMITAPVSFLKDGPAPRDYASITAIEPERMAQLAAAYDEAERDDPSAHEAYAALTQEVDQQYKDLTGRLGVKVDFVASDPYKNVEELRKDLEDNRHIAVLKTDTTLDSSGAHPYFTNEQNDKFRAVHDAFGHAATGRGFDRNGEEAAYQAHRSMFSDLAGKALATETRSQNSYLITNGEFPEQKVALMPDALIKRLRQQLAKAQAKITADDDNLYSQGHSHHTSMGRHLKKPAKKSALVDAVLEKAHQEIAQELAAVQAHINKALQAGYYIKAAWQTEERDEHGHWIAGGDGEHVKMNAHEIRQGDTVLGRKTGQPLLVTGIAKTAEGKLAISGTNAKGSTLTMKMGEGTKLKVTELSGDRHASHEEDFQKLKNAPEGTKLDRGSKAGQAEVKAAHLGSLNTLAPSTTSSTSASAASPSSGETKPIGSGKPAATPKEEKGKNITSAKTRAAVKTMEQRAAGNPYPDASELKSSIAQNIADKAPVGTQALVMAAKPIGSTDGHWDHCMLLPKPDGSVERVKIPLSPEVFDGKTINAEMLSSQDKTGGYSQNLGILEENVDSLRPIGMTNLSSSGISFPSVITTTMNDSELESRGFIKQTDGSYSIPKEHSLMASWTTSSTMIQPISSPEVDSALRLAACSHMIQTWARTANDHRPLSLAMQEAARAEFKVPEAEAWDIDSTLQGHVDRAVADHGATYQAVLRTQYNETQKAFAAQGIKSTDSIQVYRGSAQTYTNTQTGAETEYPAKDSIVSATLRPLSSFSYSKAEANKFGNKTIAAQIPVSQVVSTTATGFGCQSEGEIVVFGETVTGKVTR
jgi:hypothetical protein